jgi:hypothetical protein
VKLNHSPTPSSPLISRPTAQARNNESPQQPSQDRHQPSPEDPSPSPIPWGRLLAVTATAASLSGLSVAGMGWASAVPAFLTGGVIGGVMVGTGIVKLLGEPMGGGTGTGLAIAGAGVIGGIAGGIGIGTGAAYLANQYGDPTLGLAVGLVTAGALGYALLPKD